MATANNSFDGMFAGMSMQEIERSLRARRGALMKIACYIKTAVNAASIMPTEKGCHELEQLKERMETKTEEMEAGYDALIELEPLEEKRLLEKKKRNHRHRRQGTHQDTPGNSTMSQPGDCQPHHPGHQRPTGKNKRGSEARQAENGLHPRRVCLLYTSPSPRDS